MLFAVAACPGSIGTNPDSGVTATTGSSTSSGSTSGSTSSSSTSSGAVTSTSSGRSSTTTTSHSTSSGTGTTGTTTSTTNGAVSGTAGYLQGAQYEAFGVLAEGSNLGAPARGAAFEVQGAVGDPASGPVLSGSSFKNQGGFVRP